MTFEEFWKQNNNRYWELAQSGPLSLAIHTAAEEAWDIKDNEIERWKTMAQRHNPSGCCCQIDENNGDPKMIKPCAFHAEWRGGELEELQEEWNEEQSKMIRIRLERDALREKVNTMTVALKLCTQPLYSFEPIGAAYKAVKSALAAVEK